MKKQLLAFTLAFSLVGCATQKYATTESGWPEVTINAKRQDIKDSLIERGISKGWTIEDESASKLSLSKSTEAGSLSSTLTQVLIGNSYSTTPKNELIFLFSGKDDLVKVVGQSFTSTQMASGKVNRVPLNGAAQFNQLSEALLEVKSKLEAEKK